jgi:hypothetical protein
MIRKYLVRGIGGLALSALIILGVTASSATTANAQWRGGFHGGGWHGGGFRGGSRVVIAPRVGLALGRPYWGWRGYPYAYPYGYYSHYVFGDSTAADSQGYQDGLKTGADDAKHSRSFDPERSHYFKDAGFGNFAESYREGFDRGYSDGFGR